MLGSKKKAAIYVPSSRGFRRLLFAQVISGLGDGFTLVAIPFAVLQMTGSATSLGLVLAARLVPQAAAMMLGGVVGDRVSPGRILLLSHITRAAVQGAMAAAVTSKAGGVVLISALYALHGVATAFHYPASRAVVPRLVEKNDLQAANGLSSMASSSTTTLAPLIGGVLVAVAHAGAAIAADAFTFAAAALAVMPLTGLKASRTVVTSMRHEFVAGLQEIRSRRWLSTGMAYASLFQFSVLGAVTVLGPTVALRHYQGSSAWGILLAADGIGSLVGGFAATRFRTRRSLQVGYLAVLPGTVAALSCLAWTPPFPVAVIAFALYGLSLTWFDTLWHVALQSHVPEESLAKVFAFDGVISLALRPASLAVIGPLAAALGYSRSLVFCMCLMAAATLLVLATSRIPEPTVAAAEDQQSNEASPAPAEGCL
ncbi:MFS transporter [Streptomyces sp. IMTB 2501]|uniref:MFS transporter n=1 Tax=Streptomyces sp. IMTB 2501 TaxID=1776340 RepID=UPI0015B79F58|nr:MFS transporter [Streptomyces sp. IMTB 2501]